jgi:hypothetical protein
MPLLSLKLSEVARVLFGFDHGDGRIEDANRGIM